MIKACESSNYLVVLSAHTFLRLGQEVTISKCTTRKMWASLGSYLQKWEPLPKPSLLKAWRTGFEVLEVVGVFFLNPPGCQALPDCFSQKITTIWGASSHRILGSSLCTVFWQAEQNIYPRFSYSFLPLFFSVVKIQFIK